ncbi:28617_t:CDS:2 [Dentiscutata erythropus]|uniref:28617_t:CDS:1 n=1 Tax=Dentiscutata erythropus TaxID=1348616 RepID=A0A9N9BK30_9GLOM|nr:28617_t:CDS:2 [Dentiscutata erythropus]
MFGWDNLLLPGIMYRWKVFSVVGKYEVISLLAMSNEFAI